ncbi:MAG: hypothetical protein ACI82F_000987 [Planctomycetota bacterium]|jgi:uncharacterized protein (DUF58 family)
MSEDALRDLLPSPAVRFDANFPARLGRLVARVAAARERREGAGSARLFGAGSEFVGYRPYRPGEDLRQLDWSLFARTRKPFVRVSRREASEEWALLLDTSASMGVGRPGKLQAAAEAAAGLAAVALRLGAGVTLATSSGRVLRARARSSVAPALSFLGSLEARGTLRSEQIGGPVEQFRSAGRVIVLGDLLELEVSDILNLRRPGRELQVLQFLAPEELDPASVGAREDSIQWVDPEDGERVSVAGDPDLCDAYDEALAKLLEDWGHGLLRHRIAYGVWSSARAFEDVLAAGLF